MKVRVRLTLLYGIAFFAAGTILVTGLYLLVAHTLTTKLPSGRAAIAIRNGPDTTVGVTSTVPPDTVGTPPDPAKALSAKALSEKVREIQAATDQARTTTLHTLLVESLLALGVVGLAGGGLGWAMAGRALRPIHQITATARRVADRSLHERIGLEGPRDEVKELADTFDAMLQRLDQAFEGQRRFVANASHELRTPLAINRTLVEVALGRPDASPDVRQLGVTLLAVNERHERLIDGLLTLASSETELTARALVDLAEVAAHVTAQAGDEARAAGVEVRGSFDPAPTTGDPILVERLVQNLVHNGVRHNHPGGWISVHTAASGGYAELVVSNTGPVVASYEVPGLFEPFRRLASDRVGSARGAGLGLSIVRSVVRAHGGRLHAEARDGGGLVVRVTLPATALAPAAPRPASQVRAIEPASAHSP
jgi:signal transduction histidine kinase